MNKEELYPRVFSWLTIGLLVTFITGYTLSLNTDMLLRLLSGGSYIVLVILEFAVAIFFSVRIRNMSKMTAIICYLLYSFLTGITFGSIFVIFKLSSIITIFLTTAGVFGSFALIGYTTKRDLSKIGNFLFMALLAIIIMSIVNIFLKLPMVELGIAILGTLIFIGYIMYDIQKLPLLSSYNEEAGPIYGAFQLYLDFINVFIRLLQLFGDSRD